MVGSGLLVRQSKSGYLWWSILWPEVNNELLDVHSTSMNAKHNSYIIWKKRTMQIIIICNPTCHNWLLLASDTISMILTILNLTNNINELWGISLLLGFPVEGLISIHSWCQLCSTTGFTGPLMGPGPSEWPAELLGMQRHAFLLFCVPFTC